jgi:hypothetical protein
MLSLRTSIPFGYLTVLGNHKLFYDFLRDVGINL